MIYKFLAGKWRTILSVSFVIAALVVLAGYYPFPFWTGTIFQKGGEVFPSARVRIPDYYSDAMEWLSHSEGDTRILPLPMTTTYLGAYKWESGYFGVTIDRLLLNKPTIAGNDGSQAYQIPLKIGKDIEESSPGNRFTNLLGLVRAKYVLLHRDADWDFIEENGHFFNHDLETLEYFLGKQTDLQLVKSFGPLDFYAIKDSDPPPHIYPSSDVTLVEGGLDEWMDLLSIEGFDTRSATFFLSTLEAEPNNSLIYKLADSDNYEIERLEVLDTSIEEGVGFETGYFSGWLTEVPTGGSIQISTDSHNGEYSAEISLPGSALEARLYKDFLYDGENSINIKAWMKVVSRTPPAGAFIHLRGYDASDVEKVRIIYHTYDNWDWSTTSPEAIKEAHGMEVPYYVLKTHLGDPPYNTWLEVDQNPRNEFEARFPGVWETLNLVKIRVELTTWSNGEITARYDDISATSVPTIPVYYTSLQFKSESPSIPKVTFRKINATKYQVHINTTQPFFLVFSESYNPYWNAYLNEVGDGTNWVEALYEDALSEDNHLMVNGYANSWYIDKNGEYDIILYFKPQSFFYIGAIISSVIFTGFVGYLGLGWLQGRRRNRKRQEDKNLEDMESETECR